LQTFVNRKGGGKKGDIKCEGEGEGGGESVQLMVATKVLHSTYRAGH